LLSSCSFKPVVPYDTTEKVGAGHAKGVKTTQLNLQSALIYNKKQLQILSESTHGSFWFPQHLPSEVAIGSHGVLTRKSLRRPLLFAKQ
jgi:hypothetical protein